MEGGYREPSWRAVIVTLVATLLVIAGLILLTSRLLQENCPPGSAQPGCPVEQAPPAEGP